MKIKIATYKDLRNIKVRENDERFVVVSKFDPEIKAKYFMEDMKSFFDGQIVVREGLAKKLAKANKKLKMINSDLTLFVSYGYRSLKIQKKYFEKEYNNFKKLNEKLGESALMELAHKHIAVPEVAGHPTGGAVDLTIFDTKEKEFLDMGGKIADFSNDKLATFSSGLTFKQKKNRALLHSIMVEQDFCPFYEEWWHFSFGDKEWAWFYGKQSAIYKQQELTKKLYF